MIDYNKVAKEYARHRRVHPGVLQQILTEGDLTASARVLEVGCGVGNYIGAMAAVGCACWGIDPAAEMLDQARTRSEGVNFKPGQAEQLDFPPDFFNLVFSVDVIHHVGNQTAFFQEAYRVLRSGGKLCTVTDSEEIIRHRQPLAHYFPETATADLRRYPPIGRLRQLLDQTGFSQLTQQTATFTYQVTDIQIYRDRAYSVLHLISDEAFRRGLARMEQDLARGPMQGRSRYLLLWGTKR